MKMTVLAITSLALVCMIMVTSCGGSASSGPSVSDPVVSENSTSINEEGGGAMLDNDTELESGIQGFTVKRIYIVDGEDMKISNHEIVLNTKFSIVYEGVKNYTLKNNRAFPGLSIQVVDDNQNTIINEADLLATYADGFSEENASVLRATITVGDPMKPGKYICSVQVIDKNNKNATILSTWAFDVK
jgi:hypothetical protein